VTDRYTKAIEQLGSEKLDIRLGGIYALERVARDSAGDQPTVMEVSAAFIREHSREPWTPPAQDESSADVSEVGTRPDVQAAITVIARRNSKNDRRLINLRAVRLTRANLIRGNLTHTVLFGAELRGANLGGANLGGADLSGADLSGASLSGANLGGADLGGAAFPPADLSDARCDL
jgi:hypothetical protein